MSINGSFASWNGKGFKQLYSTEARNKPAQEPRRQIHWPLTEVCLAVVHERTFFFFGGTKYVGSSAWRGQVDAVALSVLEIFEFGGLHSAAYFVAVLDFLAWFVLLGTVLTFLCLNFILSTLTAFSTFYWKGKIGYLFYSSYFYTILPPSSSGWYA